MARKLKDWLSRYVEYASVTEAPKKMHTWAGVGAIAASLRRKVWIDMKRFTWYPSFYIIYVAPPGIVAKSTTADIAMDLVKNVPGIKFGPNAITWQALVTAFAAASESFEYPPGGGEYHPMSPLTLVASELGSLINLQDRDMVNLMIELWDGKRSYEKITKMSGNDVIEAPWINLQGCTTPHWIADNMPPATIGGGLSSRCIFIYADQKEKFIAYVDEFVQASDAALREALIHDLEYISMNLCGPYTITEDARKWGRQWYEWFWKSATERMDDKMIEGYAARKQTHMHKLAMIISASTRDDLVIDAMELQLAGAMLDDIEQDMPRVFSRVGRSETSLNAERFIDLVKKHKKIPYTEAYKYVHQAFPDFRDFEGILNGALRSGQVWVVFEANGAPMLTADVNPPPLSPHNPPANPPLPSTDTLIGTPDS